MVKKIPLLSRKYPGLVALVDDEDFERVSQFNWSPHKSPRRNGPDVFYAARALRVTRNERTYRTLENMHRFILQIEEDIDHADRNGLNNQRSNLRAANDSQNQANRHSDHQRLSNYRGVSRRPDGVWFVGIRVQGRYVFLGCFDDELDASLAYDHADRTYFGEFARLNHPNETTDLTWMNRRRKRLLAVN